MKTQFETRTSQGNLDIDFRRDAEYSGLGLPRNLDPSLRPIYGAINRLDVGSGSSRWYGSVEFVLKDEVWDRTTVTMGDSLGMFDSGSAVGTSVLNMELGSFRSAERLIALLNKDFHAYGYFEAQIFGQVDIFRDAAYILVDTIEEMREVNRLFPTMAVRLR